MLSEKWLTLFQSCASEKLVECILQRQAYNDPVSLSSFAFPENLPIPLWQELGGERLQGKLLITYGDGVSQLQHELIPEDLFVQYVAKYLQSIGETTLAAQLPVPPDVFEYK
ncbi:MAG: hypothetical protein H0W44_02580 [Gammaproteobacteria bacterium]|nr:hypothetical protein [Gammaproteobacteria bacterium]